MTAGQLREQVALQSKATSNDSQGGRVPTWSTFATVLARIESDGGADEAVAAGQVQASVMYRITVRHRDSVTTQQRIVWRSQTLQIHSVVSDERRRWLTLRCSQVQ